MTTLNSFRGLLAILAFALSNGAAFAQPAHARVADPGVTDKEIVIGQSLGLTGPVGDIGQELSHGVEAFFEAVNSKGGIHGRRIRVVTLDDGYQAQRTVTNVQKLLAEERVFALFNIMGTPNALAVLPLAQEANVPLFTPFTGADAVRQPVVNNVFHVRASYTDEIEKLIQHLATIGIKRIGVAYLASSFGKDGMAGVEKAMTPRSMKPVGTASIQPDASDVDRAVATLQGSQPEAIVMITAGKSTVEFIKRYNKARRGAQFYTLSIMGSRSNVRALGSDGVGVVVATVVPLPWTQTVPMVMEYQTAMRAMGRDEFGFASLEGYINAKVLADALQRAGRDLTRAKLISAAEKLKANYGRFDVAFGPGQRQGSRFVDLAIIGSDGRFTK